MAKKQVVMYERVHSGQAKHRQQARMKGHQKKISHAQRKGRG